MPAGRPVQQMPSPVNPLIVLQIGAVSLHAVLTGHGSAVIGSGNTTGNPSPGGQFGNMFSGGSHGMGGAGQRPSTAGGMFGPASAALANGRGGGGGANALRLQGGMAFGSPAGGMMSL